MSGPLDDLRLRDRIHDQLLAGGKRLEDAQRQLIRVARTGTSWMQGDVPDGVQMDVVREALADALREHTAAAQALARIAYDYEAVTLRLIGVDPS